MNYEKLLKKIDKVFGIDTKESERYIESLSDRIEELMDCEKYTLGCNLFTSWVEFLNYCGPYKKN